MSDENFFETDFGSESSGTPETKTTETPAATPASEPTVDPNEVAQLRSQVNEFQVWKQNASRFFGGENPQNEAPNPQKVLEDFVKDPLNFQQQLKQNVLQEAVEMMNQQRVVSDFQSKYPQYKPFQGAIAELIPQAAAEQEQKLGRRLTLEESIDAGIKKFESAIQGLNQQQSTQTQADALKRAALNLDVSGGQPPAGSANLAQLPKAEFYKMYNAWLSNASQ